MGGHNVVWLLWDPHSFPTWAGCFACAPCWSAYPRLRSQYGCGLDVSFFQHARDCCMDVANLGDTGIDQDMTSLRCNLQDPVKVKVGLSLRSKTTWCLGILQEFLLHKFRIWLPASFPSFANAYATDLFSLGQGKHSYPQAQSPGVRKVQFRAHL